MPSDPENDETVLLVDLQPAGPRSPITAPSGNAYRFAPGSLLVSRYRIISRLGKGGMGEVFRADDIILGQPVALKFLPESARGNLNLLTRFYAEVRIARQISHANVCRVYDIGEIDGQPYLSMEYIDGEDLSSLLRRIGRLPGDKAVEFARKMCAGVAAAHAQGVLHRDIKPANIMIDGRGEPRITDFGLAAVAAGVESSEIRNGTPAYMAPEQLEGREVSVQSDIYALVLHEMFTGKAAHAGPRWRSASKSAVRPPLILRNSRRHLDQAGWTRALAIAPSPVRFGYRQSPQPLVAENIRSQGAVTRTIPPLTVQNGRRPLPLTLARRGRTLPRQRHSRADRGRGIPRQARNR